MAELPALTVETSHPCAVSSSKPVTSVKVASARYGDEYIEADYNYWMNRCDRLASGEVIVTPELHKFQFRTTRKVQRTGVMFVGWGGNNGTTVTAGLLANRLKATWMTKEGRHSANYYGSLTQCSTVRIGSDNHGDEIHIPFKNLLPMLDPTDIVLGGWDINSSNIAQAMQRAKVLSWELQTLLAPHLESLKPLPSIYYPDFIAANQEDRADNVLPSQSRKEHLETIRQNIRDFKAANSLDSVIIFWTANTERFVDVRAGLNTTADEILAAIDRNDSEVSPSNIFAVAAIQEGCAYINGSPQNTLVPGIVELAERANVFLGGDDLKTGQTKMKSVLVDFLISAGIKVRSIVSYNHLGNNDGKNLSAPAQFRSKEISKSNVVDDMVSANKLLYTDDETPDHCVVIKYVPFVGDSKRAMDEYTSEIFLNGLNTIVMHNTCEDSLLAAPIILDMILVTELFQRIYYKADNMTEYERFHSVLSVLSYWEKAPMVPRGTPVVNALTKQQRSLTNILCACLGLSPDGDMLLEHKTRVKRLS